MDDFMKPEIVFDTWHQIDGPLGVESYPGRYFSRGEVDALAADNYAAGSYTVESVQGYGARWSAPGYMDCTDWTVYKTEQEAHEALEEESN